MPMTLGREAVQKTPNSGESRIGLDLVSLHQFSCNSGHFAQIIDEAFLLPSRSAEAAVPGSFPHLRRDRVRGGICPETTDGRTVTALPARVVKPCLRIPSDASELSIVFVFSE